jgi:hypothetical protein
MSIIFLIIVYNILTISIITGRPIILVKVNKNMTQNKVETYEERMAREKAKRKKEAELTEAMLLGYMAGRIGNGYAMYMQQRKWRVTKMMTDREREENMSIEQRLFRLEEIISVGDAPYDNVRILLEQVDELTEKVESLTAEIQELKKQKEANK